VSGLSGLVAGGLLVENVPVAAMTTYKFGGAARWLLEAHSEDDIVRLAGALAEELAEEPVPVMVLGRGSNVVVSDFGFPGVVVHLASGLAGLDLGEEGTVRAGGALPLPVLARRTSEAGRGGLEFYVAIPGSVGGAVCMNAGCHGSDTAEWLVSARIVDVRTGRARRADPSDLEMSYRHSAIGADDIVVGAEFTTVPRPRREAEARIREITAWRRRHQPGGTLNAGSIFKNPPGDAAGRIIDDLGLKGYRVGGVAVSERHANFFVADDGARAQDVHGLVTQVRRIVYEARGVLLEPEVRFVGRFPGDVC
jgi:UDP-N-acetylmuramate dehydrogenase